MRNIHADYKAAYIAEYQGYKTAGREEDAAVVAQILRDSYGHEVEPEQERADADRPAENTAQPPAPARGTAAAKKAPAKKAAVKRAPAKKA